VVSDILRYPLAFWVDRLGKSGLRLHEKAQGIGSARIVCDAEPQSCSAEDTFPKDTNDLEEIKKRLLSQAESVGRDLREQDFRGRTITVKVKFSDFKVVTRSRTLSEPTNSTRVIFDTAVQLLGELRLRDAVRLTGIGVANFSRSPQQARLLPDDLLERQERLDRALDGIHEKYGERALRRGRLFDAE
jgi:DNA polymerase IV